MKTTTTAADLARKTTTTKNPHGLAFDILFDEALEALEKEEAEKNEIKKGASPFILFCNRIYYIFFLSSNTTIQNSVRKIIYNILSEKIQEPTQNI